ncbi:MAG: PorT family protein [Flavobacteriales bacterium]|nr:PorT family protein [Flavobacteriales bacterium]
MKKYFGLLLFIGIFTSTYAQDSQKVRFGFAASPIISWLQPDGKYLEKEATRLGFQYGVISDIRIGDNDKYAFSTGILVDNIGGSVLDDHFHNGDTLITEFGDVKTTYKFQYLTFPLSLKLKTNEIGYLTYYGQFGLDVGFNLKARRDVEGTLGGVAYVDEDIDVIDGIVPVRTALRVAVGGEYNISGSTNLMVGLAWNNGLTNVLDFNELDEDPDGKPIFADNGVLKQGKKLKAVNNYFSLNLAVFF